MQAQQHPAPELTTQIAWAARGRARVQAVVQALAYPTTRPQAKAQARVRTQAWQHAAPQPTIQAVQAARGGARAWLLVQAQAQAQARLARPYAHPVPQSVSPLLLGFSGLPKTQPAHKVQSGNRGVQEGPGKRKAQALFTLRGQSVQREVHNSTLRRISVGMCKLLGIKMEVKAVLLPKQGAAQALKECVRSCGLAQADVAKVKRRLEGRTEPTEGGLHLAKRKI